MNKPRKIARLYNETCYQTRFNLAELKKRLDKAAEQGFTVSLPPYEHTLNGKKDD